MKAKCSGDKIWILLNNDEVLGLAKEAQKIAGTTKDFPFLGDFLMTILAAKIAQIKELVNG